MKKKILIFIYIITILTLLITLSLIIIKNISTKKIKYNYKIYEVDVKESKTKIKNTIIDSYSEYSKYIKNGKVTKKDFEKYKYLLVVAENDYCGGEIEKVDKIQLNNNDIYVFINIKTSCAPCASSYTYYLIRIDKDDIFDGMNIINKYVSVNKPKCDLNVVYKPIIYLYPEKETNVKIKLSNPDIITHSYPKYQNCWNVHAYPNGDLIDLSTNQKLYALYWEGRNMNLSKQEDGFIVEGKNVQNFLEEKLDILGLNYKEKEEFIIYWLPKLENNKYNYIRFLDDSEIDDYMKLNIEPEPDTVIRVYMSYKPLEEKVKVKNQKLIKKQRAGFTVLEWGGTKID